MTEVRLALTTSRDERPEASMAMVDRMTGLERRLITLVIPILLALVVGLGIARLTGDPLVSAGSIALFTIGGAMIGMSAESHLAGRRFRRLFAESSLFSRPQLVSLSEAGVAFESRSLPWDAITAQSRFRNTSLLHFSSMEALVIPGRVLPEGVTPEELHAQVAKWLQR